MSKLIRIWCFLFLAVIVLSCGNKQQDTRNKAIDDNNKKNSRPNIVFIYMDDLGYGDISAYGASDIETPNMDALAEKGVKFTKGYASSATCTPSRYALLTGTYPWRNKNAKILPGTAPLLIDTATYTLPRLLKDNGYNTAIVGKWHLGLGRGNVNWNKEIKPGPNQVGFDYSYIMAATQDRVPTVYINNGKVDNLDPSDPIRIDYKNNFEGEPSGLKNPELVSMKGDNQHSNAIVNGVPRIGYMTGGESAKWIDVDMADHFLTKAQNYVKSQKDQEQPFFLYYALQQPHVPRIPHPRFAGKSGMGPRGDVILEADWCVGEFMKTLEKEGLLDNTLIVFSSDNGPVLDDGYVDQAVELLGDHDPNGGLRGGKYSLFEAGTRVPFITYWKGNTESITSEALVSQIDLYNSIAQLVGSEVQTEDSKELLNVFLGKSEVGREELIIEATSRTAYKQGDWVLIPPYNGPKVFKGKNIETGNAQNFQLYNLANDPKQDQNLAQSDTIKLKQMIADFQNIRGDGFGEISQPDFNN
jgi:arylsulfatase A-like enzyme